jgi:glucose-6-phosphate 1-dehydrogenase
MTARRLVILGATGDLTGRYLLAALAEMACSGFLPAELTIVGVARDGWDTARFRQHAADRLDRHGAHLRRAGRDELVERLSYVAGDVTDPTVLAAAFGPDPGAAVAYLALPPAVFAPAVQALALIGLGQGSRIVVEKPFGTDLASAQALNRLIHRHFPEEAVFRLDHFLGKQTVQNVLGVRFANRLFEPVWNREHVAGVEITWDETVGLEGRAGYYDHTGALRDVIQNHLLQLLCLVAMERPAALDAKELRDRKVELLRAVRAATPAEVATKTVRARYLAGHVGDRQMPDYTGEPGVDPAGQTETFAEVTLFVDNERWRGVPFRLRTGKALAAERRETAIRFLPVPYRVFQRQEDPPLNRLVFEMGPDRMKLDLALNGAGDPFCLEAAALELTLAPQDLSPHARLLVEAIEGEPALSIRGDEAEECWRIVEPIVEQWAQGVPPLLTYPAGSTGPRWSDEDGNAVDASAPVGEARPGAER